MLKRNLLQTILGCSMAVILAVSVSAAVGDNLMTSASVVDASGFANDEETPEFAIDGTFDTKWCHSGSDVSADDTLNGYGDTLAWVTFDLGAEKYFNRCDIAHASLCERDFGDTEYNTSEWALLASNDLTSWTEISRVTGNTEELSSHDIDLICARYVRLVVIQGEQEDGSKTARISELMIYESDENGAQSASEAADILAAMEEQKIAEDIAFRKSLVKPAIIYWSCSAAAAAGVGVIVHFANKKKASDNA